jgi:mRNA degradation ribonuclease J1/J2
MSIASVYRDRPPQGFGVCIHRGTRQIGGTRIELACEGQRILLDLGLPLDAGDDDPASFLPEIAGVQEADPSLLALVLSHGHADHWGLAAYTSHLPVITGAATRRMLRAAAAFVPRPVPERIDASGLPDLVDRKTIQAGPFHITPYLVDRSAYALTHCWLRRMAAGCFIRGTSVQGARPQGCVVRAPCRAPTSAYPRDADGRIKPRPFAT